MSNTIHGEIDKYVEVCADCGSDREGNEKACQNCGCDEWDMEDSADARIRRSGGLDYDA